MVFFPCSRATCPRKREPPESFAPLKGAKKMRVYQDALNILNTVDTFVTAAELLQATKDIDKLRCKRCLTCREIDKKSQRRPQSPHAICKAFLQDLKRRHVGKSCACGCGLVFSEANLSILEFDHLNQATKVQRLGDYIWWSWNGGTAAMERESEKCRVICKGCHRISSAAQIAANAALRWAAQAAANAAADRLQFLGKGGYATNQKEYHAQWKRRSKDEKLAFVNEKKMEIGRCECDDPTCDRKVTWINCCAFDFAHRPGRDGDGAKVAGIANLVHDAKSLETAIPLIKTELPKCRLMHCHCHKIQETDAPPDLIKIKTT